MHGESGPLEGLGQFAPRGETGDLGPDAARGEGFDRAEKHSLNPADLEVGNDA